MSSIGSRFLFFFTIYLTSACLPSSKFNESASSNAISGGTPPSDRITLPPADDDIAPLPPSGTNGGTNTGGTTTAGGSTAPVNGGWSAAGTPWWANVSNNTQYVTKFCTQPRPLNGGAECVKESTWQHGIKDGVQYAYKATSVCRNNFVWNGSECRAPLTGGWSYPVSWWANVNDNTEYQTMYCNNPKPLTGDTPCTIPAGWTEGTKDGVVYVYKATGVCRNNFLWNGNGCVEGKHAITSVALNDPNITYDLKRFWPAPIDGTVHIKEFEYGNNFEVGNVTDPNRAKFVQRYLRQNDGTYTMQDWLVGWPKAGYTWASNWHYRFDEQRGIIEFADDIIQRENWTIIDHPKFELGNELLWGNFLKLHELLYGDLAMSGHIFGHVWVQIKESYSSYTIAGTTYNNVIKMRNVQGSKCITNYDCSSRGPESIADYYFAEGVGIIRTDWLEHDTARYLGPQNSIILTKSCTVSNTAYHCP